MSTSGDVVLDAISSSAHVSRDRPPRVTCHVRARFISIWRRCVDTVATRKVHGCAVYFIQYSCAGPHQSLRIYIYATCGENVRMIYLPLIHRHNSLFDSAQNYSLERYSTAVTARLIYCRRIDAVIRTLTGMAYKMRPWILRARLSVSYGLLTRKQRSRRKKQVVVNFLQGWSNHMLL